VPYFHLVYTLPAAIADIAYQNKAVIYDLLFKASTETTRGLDRSSHRLDKGACYFSNATGALTPSATFMLPR
jgi:hypothetical protein